MATSSAFASYDLRTTDLDAAQAFYVGLMGWQVHSSGASRELRAGAQRVGELMALPERARAQGAPAHWLGHVGVDDVEASARRFVARGGQLLGPVQQPAQGQRVAVLRDPQGAVFAMSTGRSGGGLGAVGWHELNTTDREHAWSSYSELFGWRATGTLELGPRVGANVPSRPGGPTERPGCLRHLARRVVGLDDVFGMGGTKGD